MSYPTLLVEDHPLMRQTLSQFISDIPEVDFIAAVGTGEEAIRVCREKNPRLAIIDVSLPEMSGIELVRNLLSHCPDMMCLMLSGHQEISYIQRALANGAKGYVLKGNPDELEKSIQQVIQGETYLSDTVRDKLIVAGELDESR